MATMQASRVAWTAWVLAWVPTPLGNAPNQARIDLGDREAGRKAEALDGATVGACRLV